jgi:hypothetical protein
MSGGSFSSSRSSNDGCDESSATDVNEIADDEEDDLMIEGPPRYVSGKKKRILTEQKRA